jgi:dihydrofolate reductase
MKTQYYTASSLDGFIAGPNDSLEWLFPLGNIAETSYPTFIRNVGALAMGSATYEWMLRHVVGPEAERRQPWPYQQPTWVFTSRTRRQAAAAAEDHGPAASPPIGASRRHRVRRAALRGAGRNAEK